MSKQHFKVNMTTGTILERADEFTDAWRDEVRSQLNDDKSNLTSLMEQYITLNNCLSSPIAEAIASQLNDEAGKELYMAIDRGASISPRYRVIEQPQLGDAVSREFNGDSRPCGHIKSISSTKKRITTTEGNSFYRRGNSGCWLEKGTWSMTSGHTEKTNPHI